MKLFAFCVLLPVATVLDAANLSAEQARVLQPADTELTCEYGAAVKEWPQMRGVMLPPRALNDADMETLSAWGVRLVRFQMVRNWQKVADNKDLGEYFQWIDSQLDLLTKNVLPLCESKNIKVVVDLHVAPGGTDERHEANMFFEKRYAQALVSVWRKIATRLKGHSAIYGYDIFNEPHQERVSKCSYWELQRRVAMSIREIDAETPIVVESNDWASPETYSYFAAFPISNVIYQVHMYLPLLYTHQGIRQNPRDVPYPDHEKGVDRAWLRQKLQPVREFQLRHKARIYVGEFSAVAWALNAGEYLTDCIDIFNEYGWDWTYHAFREWSGWSLEHQGDTESELKPSLDNARKTAVLSGLVAKKSDAAIRSFGERLEFDQPFFIAHRGIVDNEKGVKENTLASFEAAGAARMQAIETDVRLTADGHLVCTHDASLKRVFGIDLDIENSTLEAVRKYPVPTFAEYLEVCSKYDAVPFIETKGSVAVVARVLAELRRRGLLEVAVLSSSDFAHIREARRLDKTIFVHYIFARKEWLDELAAMGKSGLSWNYKDLSELPKGLIEKTHAKGVRCCLRACDTTAALGEMKALNLDYFPTNKMTPEKAR